VIWFIAEQFTTSHEFMPPDAGQVADGPFLFPKSACQIERDPIHAQRFGRRRHRNPIPTQHARDLKITWVSHYGNKYKIFGVDFGHLSPFHDRIYILRRGLIVEI
jgi:hypothetical protein